MKHSTQKMKVMMAGGAVASAAAAANGAIVYHDPVDVTISGRTEQRAYLDLNGGTISSTEVSGVSDLVFIVGAEGVSKPYAYVRQVPGSSGALISGSFPYAPGVEVNTATYPDVTLLGGFADGFYGISFVESGTTMYGWVRINFSKTEGEPGEADDFNVITIQDWAYETSGAPILAGAGVVPEPSSAAMMAVLAGSAALYRRRARKEVAA